MAGGSNQPVSITASNESAAPAMSGGSNAPTATTGSTEPVSASNAAASGATATASAPAAAAELPIQFQDVPITTAIESLARLAGINYLLDPKIGYGQPDQNGQIKAEPTLSIRWESVTAQQALLALLDNYGLQLVENPKTGISRITIKDPAAPPPLITRVIQLKYSSTSNMEAAVESTLTDKRSKVVPDTRTSQMVVVATEKEQADVDTLINQLDKPTRQVLIETKLIELSSNPSTSKGIDWSGTLAAQNVSFGNGILNAVNSSSSQTLLPGAPVSTTTTFGGNTVTTTANPSSSTQTTLNSEPQNASSPGGLSFNTLSGLTPDVGFLSADGVKAVISFLNASSEAQVVSTPRVVTLDNETATISVTRAFPIINVTAGTVNVSGGSQVTYSNLGTILMVTPRISANDYIWLKVNPIVSSFFGQDKQTINGLLSTADIFDLRSIDTQVLIPNAHTLVMGGLVKDNPNASYTKVPILGDIPILGLAFRSENKSMEKDNLLIFITPTIVKETDFKATESDFLDSQPRTLKDPMNMHTWIDSAQPRGDWSNPLTADKPASSQSPNQAKTVPAP
jgi:type II secretory pathway component GspD/PulD (secretin)